MGLFRRYEPNSDKPPAKSERTKLVPESASRSGDTKSKAEAAGSASQPQSAGTERVKVRRQPVRKTEPTLSRKQAEAARMERLHPNLSPKEQRRADRDARFKARAEAWDKIEASPQRVLARDFVDARWTITEFLLPGMILIMALGMATVQYPVLSSMIMLSLWVLLLLSFINTWFMWRSFKRLLQEREPRSDMRGLLMYMYNRALMIRRFRRPSPRIKRGEAI